MSDSFAVNDPYYRYERLPYRTLYHGLMSGVGQTAETAGSPHYKQWGSILEVAEVWGDVAQRLDDLASSMMAWLLTLREAWAGAAAEQHEWRMSNLMTWMSSMSREAAAIKTGLMLMSNYLDEAQAEGFQVPCPPPKKSGGLFGDILAVGSAVLTLGATQLIPAKAFGASITQPGSERRSPEMARVVANLAMNYLLTEHKYWNAPLLNPLSLEPRQQPTITLPQAGSDDGAAGGDGGSSFGGDGGPSSGGDGGFSSGGDGGPSSGGDGYEWDDDGGTGTSSGLASAGALGSGTSFGSGAPSWPQPAAAPMVGAVPGVLGSERLAVPAPGGSAAGGPGMVPPMMGMMGGGAPAGGSSDQPRRSGKFWREDEIEWSRDPHAQWADPDERPPSSLDTRQP